MTELQSEWSVVWSVWKKDLSRNGATVQRATATPDLPLRRCAAA
ncbi:MAG TPA: hypothetical protein VE980_22850 [Pyrinomonadaceae bacterium]|nr:hypothetical protein [Pyrinomonadaceae bacterium]